MTQNIFRDMLWGAILVALVFNIVLGSMIVVTQKWEYRAVHHHDCASYLTET